MTYRLSVCSLRNFNPRSREGSDGTKLPSTRFTVISIHAPAKGATVSQVYSFRRMRISIHAPAKGAAGSIFQLFFHPVFQSTLPRRKRPLTYSVEPSGIDISIHAPAKGATHTAPRSALLYLQFQSTLPRRERRKSLTVKFPIY